MTKLSGENSYKNILKGISLFGSVQALQIFANVVRVKLVAIFLGPEGMGIAALFTSSSQTIQRFSSLGLNLAIVKEVANRRESPEALSEAMAVASRLIAVSAILGALVCAIFSRQLSQLTFHSADYAPAFLLLSLTVALSVAANGLLALLQGLHEAARLSKASLVSALTGLLAGVPLYWLLGYDGIVPAMTILALSMVIFYVVALRKALRHAATSRVRFSWQSHRPLVRRLVALGLVLMASDLIGSGCTYVLQVFIRSLSSLDAVGLYQGANSLTNQYSGMVFAALALDFLPRLSAAASRDDGEMRDVVCRQLEMVALIITPIVAALVLSAPIVVRVLLTENYLPIVPLMRWMGLGVLVKALMFPLGYISFAKDNKKVFFWLEGILGNLLTLSLSMAGFHFFGLIGLGYAMVADNFICLIIYYVVNRRLYGFGFDRNALTAMATALALGIFVFASAGIPSQPVAYSLMSTGFLASVLLSWRGLRSRLKRG